MCPPCNGHFATTNSFARIVCTCDATLTVLSCCYEGFVQCANCFAAVDVSYDPTERCVPKPSDMNPVSFECKKVKFYKADMLANLQNYLSDPFAFLTHAVPNLVALLNRELSDTRI